MLNPLASPFAPSLASNAYFNRNACPIQSAILRLRKCGAHTRDIERIKPLLTEWFTTSTLNGTLKKWEEYNSGESESERVQNTPMTFILYNVEALNARHLEVTELAHQTEASFVICTEIGELGHHQQITNYNMFYEKGTNKNGGVAIGVGKHLKAAKLETNIENTLAVDIFGLNEPLRVIGIYWPEKQKRSLDDILPFITKNTLIAGDFNAAVQEWNSPSTDNRGKLVKNWSEHNYLKYIGGTFNSSKRSLRNIDYTLANFEGIKGETLNFGTSDHWPLVYKSELICLSNINKFSISDWKTYELFLCLMQEFWMTQLEYSGALEWYKTYIRFLTALKNRLTRWEEKDMWRPALPQEILRKLKELRKIKNRFQHQHLEEDRIEIRQRTRSINSEIWEYRSNRWNQFLATIQKNHMKSSTQFWRNVSRIYKPATTPFNKLKDGNRFLISRKEITDELADHYKKLYSPPIMDLNSIHDQSINREYNQIAQELSLCNIKIRTTNTTEVKKYIRELKPKKSAGIDTVSNFMIKKLPPAYIECLTKCFNIWLDNHSYPEVWKVAKIITLNKLKAGIPNCEQTRPISLLATHSKIYEKIMLDRIKNWSESNNIIPKEQSGFRKGCLLQTRVLSILQEVKNNLAGNVPTLGIYVDYKKAYDLVWHEGLIVKLYRMQVPMQLLKILLEWLKGRKAYISFGSNKSELFSLPVGLPQGSSLSPYIFIMYHADITNSIRAFSTHIFADDLCTLITPPIHTEVKEMVKFINSVGSEICQNLYNYSIKWKQPINIDKTVVQIFHSQVKTPQVEIKMNNCKLDTVRSFKYLGVTWSDKLSLKPTVLSCMEKVQKSYVKLKWLQKNKEMSTKVLRTCFFAYSFPFFTWLFPLFPLLPNSLQNQVRRKYRVGIRLIHRCPFTNSEELLRVTKEVPLEQYICRYLKKRLANAHKTDLGSSMFYEDVFMWEHITQNADITKRRSQSLKIGHFYRNKRVKSMLEKHQSDILTWMEFEDQHDTTPN